MKTQEVKAENGFWCFLHFQNKFENDLQNGPKTMQFSTLKDPICIPHLFQVCWFVDSTRERCLRFKLGLGMRLECQEQMQRSGNSPHPIFFQRRLRLNVVSQSRCLDSDARLYPFHDNHYDRLICPFPSPLHSGMLSAWLKTSVSHLVTSREVG